MKHTSKLTAEDKFRILHRDNFECRYCRAKPGSDMLEVDHLVPVSMGGSDDEINLVAACKKCNRSRSDQPLFPPDMIIGEDDEGWHIIKVWGVWSIKACDRGVVIAGAIYGVKHDPRFAGHEYWFDASRAHELDWYDHIEQKGWGLPHKMEDFAACLEYARRLTRP